MGYMFGFMLYDYLLLHDNAISLWYLVNRKNRRWDYECSFDMKCVCRVIWFMPILLKFNIYKSHKGSVKAGKLCNEIMFELRKTRFMATLSHFIATMCLFSRNTYSQL